MRLLAFLLTCLALSMPVAAEIVRLGDRFYSIDLPANPKGAPLILALHGGGGDPDQFASSSGSSTLRWYFPPQNCPARI
ncbi:MAG: hypothetical protein B7Z04_12275 [Rhodobacterales bacterium 32-66-9]|nr:MAG: hypothetical protein B7Z04_12275 [Rhodobacterales bacterium 32-66-9]